MINDQIIEKKNSTILIKLILTPSNYRQRSETRSKYKHTILKEVTTISSESRLVTPLSFFLKLTPLKFLSLDEDRQRKRERERRIVFVVARGEEVGGSEKWRRLLPEKLISRGKGTVHRLLAQVQTSLPCDENRGEGGGRVG